MEAKSAAMLRQLSGLFLIIKVFLPTYPVLDQPTRAARHVASQEGRNSRGSIPVSPSKAMTPDSVIRALQRSMLPIRPEKKSNRQLKSTKGLDAGLMLPDYTPAVFPKPATKRDQAI